MNTMKLFNSAPQFFPGRLLIAAFILAFCSPVSAQSIFSNGAANLNNSGETFNADRNANGSVNMVGNVFTPSVSGTATSVSFAGLYFNNNILPTSDTFTISLYAVSGGVPTTLIASSTLSSVTRTLDGIGGYNGNYSVYNFSGTLNTQFTLTAGTSYYLGISDTTFPHSEQFNVAYSAGSANALFQGLAGLGDFGSQLSGYALSFSLSGTVVTPPTDTPTMPPWGLAVLTLLLLFISARTLPKRRVGV